MIKSSSNVHHAIEYGKYLRPAHDCCFSRTTDRLYMITLQFSTMTYLDNSLCLKICLYVLCEQLGTGSLARDIFFRGSCQGSSFHRNIFLASFVERADKVTFYPIRFFYFNQLSLTFHTQLVNDESVSLTSTQHSV